jgi:hypothetical protein
MDAEKQAKLRGLKPIQKKMLYYFLIENIENLEDVAKKFPISPEYAGSLQTDYYKILGIKGVKGGTREKRDKLIAEYREDFKALYPTLASIETEGASETPEEPIPAPAIFTSRPTPIPSPQPPTSQSPTMTVHPAQPQRNTIMPITVVLGILLVSSFIAIIVLIGMIQDLNRPASVTAASESKILVTSSPQAGPTYTPIPLPFKDDFTNGISPLWTISNGQWMTINGYLVPVFGKSPVQYEIMLDSPSWRNYKVVASFHIPYASGPGGWDKLLFLIRYQADKQPSVGYLFSKTEGQMVSYNMKTKEIIPLSESTRFSADVDFIFTLEAIGNTYVVYQGGTEFLRINITGYDSGGFMLVSNVPDPEYGLKSVTWFDWIKVEPLP